MADTVQLTLLVIGTTGFGMDIPWNIPKTNGKICELVTSPRVGLWS